MGTLAWGVIWGVALNTNMSLTAARVLHVSHIWCLGCVLQGTRASAALQAEAAAWCCGGARNTQAPRCAGAGSGSRADTTGVQGKCLFETAAVLYACVCWLCGRLNPAHISTAATTCVERCSVLAVLGCRQAQSAAKRQVSTDCQCASLLLRTLLLLS